MPHDPERDLRALLRRLALDRGYAPDHIGLRAINSGGANYTSVLFLATLSSPDLPDLKLFAKVAAVGDKFRERMNADALFKAEQTFYNRIVDVWTAFDEKHQVPEQQRIVFPKFYCGNPEKGSETVVLQNLVAAGYGSCSRFESVDWEHAAKAIEVLAKYHALSYVHAREDPEDFAGLMEELKFEMKQDDEGAMRGLWLKMVEGALAAVEERQAARVRGYFAARDARALFERFHRPSRAPVLVHGDYRPSNLLFKKQDGAIEAIALDFQTVRPGCPVTDLLYFTFMGTDEAFRRAHYHQLVEHYYLQLGLALKRYQMEVGEVYPREHFDEDLKESLPYALLLGVVVLPVVTVQAESAPSMEEDVDAFVVPPNQLYAQRFQGIVNDLMRWGVI